MAVAISKFYPLIDEKLAGVPGPNMDRAIQNAAIEAYEVSGFWQQDLPPMDIIANQVVYSIKPPNPDSVIHDLPVALIMGPTSGQAPVGIVYKKTQNFLDRFRPGWRQQLASYPTYFFFLSQSEVESIIQVAYTPQQTLLQSWVSSALLRPADNATSFPDHAYRQLRELIVAGALQRLFGQEQTNWRSPAEEAKYAKIWKQLVNRRRIEREFGEGQSTPFAITGGLGEYTDYQ